MTSNNFSSKRIAMYIAALGLLLGVLPELMSEEMKSNIKNLFGGYYDKAWVVMFIISSVVFLYLTFSNDNKNVKTINKAKIKGNENDIEQGISPNPLSTDKESELDIDGDKNKFKQG